MKQMCNVADINSKDFMKYTASTKLVIKKKDSLINVNNLKYFTDIKFFKVHKKNPYYTVEENVLFNKDKTLLIKFPGIKKEEYTVPESVKKIEDGAFYYSLLENIILPKSLEEIGNYAFSFSTIRNTILSNVYIKIGMDAFLASGNNIDPAVIIDDYKYLKDMEWNSRCALDATSILKKIFDDKITCEKGKAHIKIADFNDCYKNFANLDLSFEEMSILEAVFLNAPIRGGDYFHLFIYVNFQDVEAAKESLKKEEIIKIIKTPLFSDELVNVAYTLFIAKYLQEKYNLFSNNTINKDTELTSQEMFHKEILLKNLPEMDKAFILTFDMLSVVIGGTRTYPKMGSYSFLRYYLISLMNLQNEQKEKI